MLHFTIVLYILAFSLLGSLLEASKTFSCYENLHSLTRSPSGQSQSLLSQPRDGEYPGNGQICIPRVLTVTVSFLEKELRAIYCHIKQNEDKLSAASQMATTITAPSFPAPAGMHRSIVGQRNHNLEWNDRGCCDQVGMCGPTGSLSSLEPSGRCHRRRQLGRQPPCVPPSSCTPATPAV